MPTDKRVLIVGAETDVGRAIATRLADSGASLGLVSAVGDPEPAFSVQRLSRRLSRGGAKTISQAVDATNEMAVRVMVRQVAKDLGPLDATVFCADRGTATADALGLVARLAIREMERSGGGLLVVASAVTLEEGEPVVRHIETHGRTPEEAAADVVAAITGE